MKKYKFGDEKIYIYGEDTGSTDGIIDGNGYPSEKYDISKNDHDKAAEIISDFTGIDSNKLKNFIDKFGLKAILDEPSIICSSQEQENNLALLKDLLIILEKESEDDGPNTNKSI